MPALRLGMAPGDEARALTFPPAHVPTFSPRPGRIISLRPLRALDQAAAEPVHQARLAVGPQPVLAELRIGGRRRHQRAAVIKRHAGEIESLKRGSTGPVLPHTVRIYRSKADLSIRERLTPGETE